MSQKEKDNDQAALVSDASGTSDRGLHADPYARRDHSLTEESSS